MEHVVLALVLCTAFVVYVEYFELRLVRRLARFIKRKLK